MIRKPPVVLVPPSVPTHRFPDEPFGATYAYHPVAEPLPASVVTWYIWLRVIEPEVAFVGMLWKF
ncbi:MAG: hypothetical protein ACKOEM_21160 [Planctomycetia bacterium]